MQARTLIALFAVALILTAAAPATAQKTQPSTAAADAAAQAIEEIAAWNLKAARRSLKRAERDFGSTPELATAAAILDASEAMDGDSSKLQAALRILENKPKSAGFAAVADYWRGEILYHQGNNSAASAAWRSALDEAEKATSGENQNAAAQFYLGASLVRNKQYGRAREALETAQELGFDRAMVQHQIGLSHLFARQWGPARKAFDAAIEAESSFAPSYYWRAMAWDKLGRTDNMLIDLDQFVKLAPGAPEAGKAKAVLASAGR